MKKRRLAVNVRQNSMRAMLLMALTATNLSPQTGQPTRQRTPARQERLEGKTGHA
jgi:hypothetical protein